VRVKVKEVDFAGVQQDWLNLEASGHLPEVYQTFWWQDIWWRHYGDNSKKLLLLAAYRGNRFIGVAPFFIQRIILKKVLPVLKVIRFIGSREFDYAGFPVVPEYASEAIDIFFQYLGREYPGHVSYFTDLPEQSLRLIEAGNNYFPYVKGEEDFVCHQINFPGKWEEYRRGLGASTKKNLSWYGNKLKRVGGLSLERLFLYSQSDADEFFSMHYRRWKMNPDDPSLAKLERYEKEVMQLLSQKGMLRLFFLNHDGKRISAMFMYDYHGKRYFHKGAYDPDYKESRAGSLILYESIKDAFQCGLQSYDFLRGDEEYKKLYTKSFIQCYKVIMAKKKFKAKLFELIAKG